MNLGKHALTWETADGRAVEIRPIRPDDEAGLLAFQNHVSEEKLRPPGFGGGDVLSQECLMKLCRPSSADAVGFVAEWNGDKGKSNLVGVSRLFIHPENGSAELALEVVKEWQGKGLSDGLIKPLIAVARELGLKQIVTGAQSPMMSIATRFGFVMNMEYVDLATGTFKVIRHLDRGIDLTKYDPANISKAEIKDLVGSMYKFAGGNEEIKDFFLQIDPVFAVKSLDELFHGSDVELKNHAIELLVFLKGPESLPWIEKCLTDDDVNFRCAGCSFLAEVHSPEAVQRLLQCLREDPSDWVRYSAVEALADCGDLSVIPTLRQTAKNDRGTDYEGRPIRGAAREAIKRITARNQ